MPIISVIVPVYKVEKFIHRCVDSLLAQSFRDFELILVDDGSPDRCGAICDAYADQDPRVRVIHQQNGGASSARNAGLALATGDYIMFCDADDALMNNALSVMIEVISKPGVQMVVGGLQSVFINVENGTVRITQNDNRKFRYVDLNNSEELYSCCMDNNMLSSCVKLYRSEIIMRNNIQFPVGQIVLEDFSFVLDYLSHCDKICMIPENVYSCYSYSDRPIQTRRSSLDFYDDVLSASNKLTKFLERRQITEIASFQKLLLHIILINAYELLWQIEAKGLINRCRKYMRIQKALAAQEFQQILNSEDKTYTESEKFFMKRKCIVGILGIHILQRMFRRNKN